MVADKFGADNFRKVVEKLTRREFASAEAFTRSVIARHGVTVANTILLSRVLRSAGHYSKALEELNAGLATYPASMRLAAEKGSIYQALGRYGHASKLFTEALAATENDLNDPMGWEFIQDNLAMAQCRLGDFIAAGERLRPLVVMHPEVGRFREHYAQILAKDGNFRYDAAVVPEIGEEYGKYLELSLSYCLLEERRFYDALRRSRRLLDRYPDEPGVILCRAAILKRLLRFPEAMEILENAVKRQCANASVYVDLGECRQKSSSGNLSVREAYLNGLLHYPDNVVLLSKLMSLDYLADRTTEAYMYLKRILSAGGGIEDAPFKFMIGSLPLTFTLPATEESGTLAKSIRTLHTHWADMDQKNPPNWSNWRDPDDPGIASDVSGNVPMACVLKNNAVQYMDCESLRFTVRNGNRVVTDQPKEYEYSVFLAGPCLVSNGFPDSLTLGSTLQQVFNRHSRASTRENVRVVNYGILGGHDANCLKLLDSGELRPGDKVMYYGLRPYAWYLCGFGANWYDWHGVLDKTVLQYVALRNELKSRGVELYLGFAPILGRDEYMSSEEKELLDAFVGAGRCIPPGDMKDLDRIFDNKLADAELTFAYFDHVLKEKKYDAKNRAWGDLFHYYIALNRPLAEAMYAFVSSPSRMKTVEDIPDFKTERIRYLQDYVYTVYADNKGIQSWLSEAYTAAISERDNVGAIVMNCNPFTLGHKYLIEEALESVEALYVFVVQEDASHFSFADRYSLVKAGVGNLGDNVAVVPSGEFIISSYYFSEYFSKERVNVPVDSTSDLAIFGALIAPALNIRTRFVGEEPNCAVTRSYNERMLHLLPGMGVDVRVIPRKECAGQAISASSVRKALTENDWETVAALVPESTYAYLRQSENALEQRTSICNT